MAASGRLSTLPPSSLSSLPSSSSSSSSHPPPLLSPKISSFLRSSPSLPFPSLSLVQSPSALRSATPRRTGPRSRSRSSAGSFFVAAGFTTLADAELVPVPKDPLELQGKFPPAAGVYGVYDGDGTLQFVGISRNIAASIAGHAKFVPDLCCLVKLGLVDGTEPDQNVLTDAWKTWMEEHIKATGKVPPGNESGNNTWVRRRPKKSDIRLTPGRHVQLTVPLDELIDRLVKETKVVAFIKGSRNAPQCGFSQRVIGILESHGVDFESVNVLDEEYNSGLRETLKSYSNWPTFPQLFVGGELVGGCDIVTSMAETGELAALFQK